MSDQHASVLLSVEPRRRRLRRDDSGSHVIPLPPRRMFTAPWPAGGAGQRLFAGMKKAGSEPAFSFAIALRISLR